MTKINTFLFFLLAPLCAFILVSLSFINYSQFLNFKTEDFNNQISIFQNEIKHMNEKVTAMVIDIKNNKDNFNNQSKKLNEQSEKAAALNKTVVSNEKLAAAIAEKNILKKLGASLGSHTNDNIQVRIFNLIGDDYRGYLAKVKLFNSDSFKVVIANDTNGTLETTSSAAKRHDAVLAINGGGFYYKNIDGKSIPQMIGYTVVNGKLVNPFPQNPGYVFFAGVDKNGQVIGNVPKSASELYNLDPHHGVSFIPQLLKDGKKLAIPTEWQNKKHPRTVLGKFSNGDLMMLVIDGRQPGWSSGITLEELQTKLLQLGVIEAYNLDGGGSSLMYYNGKILNKPSDNKERPVVNNIIIVP